MKLRFEFYCDYKMKDSITFRPVFVDRTSPLGAITLRNINPESLEDFMVGEKYFVDLIHKDESKLIGENEDHF